jgi:hypothetical protein
MMSNDAKNTKGDHHTEEGIFGKHGHLKAVRLDAVTPEQIAWLDKGYVPLGKVTG